VGKAPGPVTSRRAGQGSISTRSGRSAMAAEPSYCRAAPAGPSGCASAARPTSNDCIRSAASRLCRSVAIPSWPGSGCPMAVLSGSRASPGRIHDRAICRRRKPPERAHRPPEPLGESRGAESRRTRVERP
jgi:hypothetical protein